MRAVLIALLTLLPTSALAGPVQITFTGTLTSVSTLTTANGDVVNLASAPFTVSAITTGMNPAWDPAVAQLSNSQNPWTNFMYVYLATATWDFGIYGTAIQETNYVQYFTGDHLFRSFALDSTWDPLRLMFSGDQRGIQVTLNTPLAIASDPTTPTPLGQLPLDQFTPNQGFHTFALTTTSNDTITFRFDGRDGTQFSLTSASVVPTPEPSSLLLLVSGLALTAMRRWCTSHR